MNAIVVAMDLIVRAKGTTKKGLKRISLITCATDPLQPPSSGASLLDEVTMISTKMEELGIILDAIVLSESSTKRKIELTQFEENKDLLEIFTSRTRGSFSLVPDFSTLKYRIKPRVSPTTTYRGDLEITPNLKFKVQIQIRFFKYFSAHPMAD